MKEIQEKIQECVSIIHNKLSTNQELLNYIAGVLLKIACMTDKEINLDDALAAIYEKTQYLKLNNDEEILDAAIEELGLLLNGSIHKLIMDEILLRIEQDEPNSIDTFIKVYDEVRQLVSDSFQDHGIIVTQDLGQLADNLTRNKKRDRENLEDSLGSTDTDSLPGKKIQLIIFFNLTQEEVQIFDQYPAIIDKILASTPVIEFLQNQRPNISNSKMQELSQTPESQTKNKKPKIESRPDSTDLVKTDYLSQNKTQLMTIFNFTQEEAEIFDINVISKILDSDLVTNYLRTQNDKRPGSPNHTKSRPLSSYHSSQSTP
jgi:hypothetical protein